MRQVERERERLLMKVDDAVIRQTNEMMLVKLTRHVERTVLLHHHHLHQHSLDAAAAVVLLNAVNTSKNSLLQFSTFLVINISSFFHIKNATKYQQTVCVNALKSHCYSHCPDILKSVCQTLCLHQARILVYQFRTQGALVFVIYIRNKC